MNAIRLVKADEETARLQPEFFRMAEHPRF
jgi:hypothetical protein